METLSKGDRHLSIKDCPAAIIDYENSINLLPRILVSSERARFYFKLGQCQDLLRWTNPELPKEEGTKKALASYQSALSFASQVWNRQLYGAIEAGIGGCYFQLSEYRSPKDNLDKSIEASLQGLKFLKYDSEPNAWIGACNQLGIAYGSLAKVEDRFGNLKKEANIFELAIKRVLIRSMRHKKLRQGLNKITVGAKDLPTGFFQVLVNYSMTLADHPDLVKSSPFGTSAIEMLKQYLEVFPADSEVGLLMKGKCLKTLGDLTLKGQTKEDFLKACEFYQDGLTCVKNDSQATLEITSQLGFAKLGLSKFENPKENLAESKMILKELKKTVTRRNYPRIFANALYLEALIELKEAETKDSAKHLVKAKGLFVSLLEYEKIFLSGEPMETNKKIAQIDKELSKMHPRMSNP